MSDDKLMSLGEFVMKCGRNTSYKKLMRAVWLAKPEPKGSRTAGRTGGRPIALYSPTDLHHALDVMAEHKDACNTAKAERMRLKNLAREEKEARHEYLGPAPTDPTPEEIRRQCEQIRREWTPERLIHPRGPM